MSASATATSPLIAGRDILLLVRGYARDNLQQWGQVGLLTQVLGQDPHIHTIDWAIDELAAQLVCVINVNSPDALILRIIVTPDFIWLGFHAVPLGVAIPLAVYARFLEDAILHSPLTSGVLSIGSLHFENEWMALQNSLFGYLGPPEGSPAAIIKMGPVIPPACADVPETFMIDSIPMMPPPPPNNDPHYGGGVRITGRDGLEVPRKQWRY
ncbi:hypothetical protein PMG11_08270 [Penicillium brasilianum]|uniref:Uncharacterized protein n=1 Tax=Penicillium brasilianum TaxID=104259 RepID=A0A0F7TSH9_PENBI|nr:hypothetical protein PMG11_08270 [Penicillium brasilianum]